MGDWRGDVLQNGVLVARCSGTEEDVLRETAHYAMVYGQDGPVAVKIVPPRTRKNPEEPTP